MLEDKMLAAMNYIAGSCMTSPRSALETILGVEPTEEEVDAFEIYLMDNECYECEHCGWYTHPSESCECEEENEK